MLKIRKELYSAFIELAAANTCNTVYPMSVAEEVQEGDIAIYDPSGELMQIPQTVRRMRCFGT